MEPMDQIRNVQKMMGSDVEAMRKTAREKVWGYIAAALGLVAGLAWNEAIKGLIDHYSLFSAIPFGRRYGMRRSLRFLSL